jgi:hypothetical protein
MAPRIRRLAAAGLSVLIAFGGAAPALAAPPKKVRRIRIVSKDIFDTSRPSENEQFYRLVNKLHISTKEHIIRREMLLREGDVYVPRLKRESERALRRILRLRRVKITTIPIDRNRVDLLVETQETWSTEPTVSLQGVGEDLSGKVGLRERNLFGLGKEASFFYKKDTGKITRSYSYGDPNVLGTRLRLDMNYDQKEEGVGRLLSIERPFYSTITPWSAGVKGVSNAEDLLFFDGGRETQRFHHRDREFAAFYAKSVGSTPKSVRRAGVGYRYLEDRLESNADVLLKDKLYHVAEAGFQAERVDFLSVDHIKLYDREEDFNMGPSLDVTYGHAGKWADRAAQASFVKLKAFAGRDKGVSHFDLATLEADGRYEDGGWRSSRARADYEYYNHFSPRQTFAFHLAGEYLANPDPSEQVLLGGDRGLRGYQLNQFAGNKLALVNFENRFFIVEEVWKLLGLGSVIFLDAGYVWDENEKVNLGDLKMDVGAGLRFHISRSSFGNVLRLDFAYAVHEIPGESRFVVTFGSSQAF